MTGLGELYFEKNPDPNVRKLAAEQLKLATQIPSDCEVYVFYIPGIKDKNQDLQKTLTDWGAASGKNVFVGMLTQDAFIYKQIIKLFNISNAPAVVVSALPKFATDEEYKNARTVYARIDNEKLIRDQDESIKCIQKIYNLFLQGQVKQAIADAKKAQWRESFNYYLGRLRDGAGHALSEFLKREKIVVDILKGQITFSPTDSSSTTPSTTKPSTKQQ